jgi:pyruvate dehydrogenase E2 component (dihydrolipoamide acetyltransferase)
MAHHKPSSANPNDFILPDLGEGVAEAELLKWRVKVGDTVAEHDILADMETDKAVVEVPSPRAGVIAALHGQEGEIIKVGSALVTYQGAAGAAPAPAHPEPKPAKAGTPSNNGSHAHAPAPAPAPAGEREDEGTVVGKVGGALAGITAQPGKALATPAVRRLARDLGVDIDAVAGTGIGGRVLEKDVRDALAGGGRSAGVAPARGLGDVAPMDPEEPHSRVVDAPARPVPVPPAARAGGAAKPAPAASPSPTRRDVPSFPSGSDSIRVPFRGVRRTIANRLRESVNQAVHFNVMDEADVSALDALRKKLAAASGEKLSFLPFVAAAVCRVLTRAEFRAMNATVDEKPSDANYDAAIVQHRAVHLGIATDTEAGLMVPVIRDCDALGVLEIGRHIAHAAESARSRTAPRESLMGSTFTISNVGSHAGRFATPIINYPEAAILAVGRARQAPVVRHGPGGGVGIFVGNLLPLSLACDHRVVDGATAALALAEMIRLLQEPESLLGPARG